MSNRKNIAAAFAAQNDKHGKASNLFFEGRVIYSYGKHFPIAVITGHKQATVNSDKYSASTSIQQGAVKYALHVDGYTIDEADTDAMRKLASKFANVAQ